MSDQGASEQAAIVCPKGCPLRVAGAPPLVLIPLAHYRALLEMNERAGAAAISFKQLSKPARSRIERDPEVAVFITLKLGLLTVKDIERAVRKRYGAKRTPSTKAIYRYWSKLRLEAARKRGSG